MKVFVDDDAAEFECVVERLFEAHVEPVVDRCVEEAQRESVNDQARRQRERDEQHEQAAAQPRARRAAAHVRAQAPQTQADDDDERGECDKAAPSTSR
jgi:hypothetical protein